MNEQSVLSLRATIDSLSSRWRLETGASLVPALHKNRHAPPARNPIHWTRRWKRLFYFPVPVNATVSGLLFALSLTLIVAVRVPVAPGVKVTEIVQVDFAARLESQVFVGAAKSPGSAPVNVMIPIVKAVERLLVSVTFLAALLVPTFCAANVNEAGTTFVCTMPVPDNEAVCGLFEAASVTVRVPVSAPMMLGVNVTVMTQLPFAGMLPSQVSLSVKSRFPVAILEMVSGTSSLLVNVMSLEALGVL